MISLSYTITPTITDNLVAIDTFRRTILTTPVSPRNESKIRWSATISHITGSAVSAETTMSKSQIVAMLTHLSRHPTKTEQLVYMHKHVLEWIREEWTANPKPVTFQVIETLASNVLPQRVVEDAIQTNKDDIRHVLTYLQSQSDHAVLIAGIAQGSITSASRGNSSLGLICRLMTVLILAKYGYDCHGFLALDPYWIEDQQRYERALQSIERTGQLTAWLEYYTAVAETAYENLTTTITRIAGENAIDAPLSTWQLRDREEHILHRLDAPTSRITNSDVQRSFHVSQVTASRDLSHLTALGLLFSHGKGRSVYYTRA